MSKTELFVRTQPGGVFSVVDNSVTTGAIWWVDSGSATGADAVGYGQNPDAPFLTIDYAVGQCTAGDGDIIYAMPGHAETVSAAGGLDLDKIGIKIVGLGHGTLQPTVTLDTADTADIDVDAASITVENIHFKANFLDIAAAMPAATAIELIHCYSLVHDDLPAMDDDDLRRGQPTVHKAFDEATAILAGDGLLTLAFEVLAEPQSAPDPVLRAELVLALARASGLAGMVGGQMFDLEAEGRYAATPPEGKPWPGDVRRIQAMKTGALLAAAVEMGAILGRASLAQRMALAAYGQALGAAFQVADDVLDVESSAEALGKATAKDAEANKATLVAALGLEAARQERDRLAADAASALGRFGPEADMLRAAARFAAARTV